MFETWLVLSQDEGNDASFLQKADTGLGLGFDLDFDLDLSLIFFFGRIVSIEVIVSMSGTALGLIAITGFFWV